MNKWQRIQFVKLLDLNTEESVLVKNLNFSKDALHLIKHHDKFSLRTFNKDDNSFHPHYPVVSKVKLCDLLPKLLNDGYSCIIGTCINPREAEFAGCAYKRGQSITLEIKYGPVTVRKVTHEGDIDKTFTTGLISGVSTGDRRLDIIIKAIRRTPVNECIFEFSWYKTNIGYKKQNMIFWEVTGAADKSVIVSDTGIVLNAKGVGIE